MGLNIWIAVILYFVIILLIGYYSSKQIYNNSDFSVGNRHANSIIVASTLAATEIGVGSSLGVYEKAYGSWGMSAAWYVLAMSLAFIILSIISPKFSKIEVKTIPEYFRRRYGKLSGVLSAILMILPLILLALVQVIAAGKILSYVFSIDYKIAVVIMSVVITSYTILGGELGLLRINTFLIGFIVIGFLLILPYSFRLCTNLSVALNNLPYEKLDMFSGISIPTIISLIIMYVATFSVGQETASAYFSIKHSYHASRASLFAAVFMLFFAFSPTFLGLVSFVLEKMGRIDSFIIFKDGLRYGLLNLIINCASPFIIGVMFISLLSITMSSADSDLLSIGLIFTNDLYKIYLDKDADDKQIIKITRIVTIMVGVIVCLLALFNSASIIKLLIFTFSFRAAGCFIPYIYGLYWSKSSSTGAIASFILGTLSFVILEILDFTLFGFDSIVFALIISLISFISFSLLYPPVINSFELMDFD